MGPEKACTVPHPHGAALRLSGSSASGSRRPSGIRASACLRSRERRNLTLMRSRYQLRLTVRFHYVWDSQVFRSGTLVYCQNSVEAEGSGHPVEVHVVLRAAARPARFQHAFRLDPPIRRVRDTHGAPQVKHDERRGEKDLVNTAAGKI